MTEKEFKALILPMKNLMFFVARQILEDEHDAEDAVQDACLKAWQKRDSFNEIKNLKAWLCTVTKNIALNKVKNKGKIQLIEKADENMVEEEKTVDQSTENKAKVALIFSFLKELPQKQADCFKLRESQQMTYKEIGDIMDMDENNVKTNIFRARKKLRSLFQKHEKNNPYGKLG